MIDTTKFYAYITNMVLDRLQDKNTLKRKGVKLYGNGFYLMHPFKYDNPKVYFNLDKREISIETSVPKLLQGHNVFGSNKVEYLCLAVLNLIYQRLGLRFDSRERRLVKNKRIRLGRVDITCSFRLASLEDVVAVVEACSEHLRAEGCQWASEGQNDFESTYHQKHSKRVAEKFYAKYIELLVKRHKIPDSVAERDLIMQYARTLLRFEVMWRAPELHRLDLEYADDWTPALVREKLMARLDRLNLKGAIKQTIASKLLDGLNPGAQACYDFWTQGCNLRRSRQYPPVSRARELLLEHNVDIFRRPDACSDIALNELLIAQNAYFLAPKRLTRQGLICGVRSRRR